MATNDEQPEPQKMPASHKWAVTSFIAVAGVNIMLNANGYFDMLGVVVTVTSLAGIVGVLVFRRSPRTYTVGVIALAFVLLRAGQSTFLRFSEQLRGAGDGWIHVGGTCWFFFLLILLFRAYTFGSPSRQYYGFPPTPDPKGA